MKNDDSIMLLKKTIDEKKKKLAEEKINYRPITNLVIEWRNEKINLNVATKEKLVFLSWELESFKSYCDDKKVSVDICGYKISEWISDISYKLLQIEIKNEESQLKQYESRLNKLLSEEKKTELEIDEIAKLLG